MQQSCARAFAMRDIPRAIMPLVDRVWQFVRAGGVPAHGHNIWIYHHREDGEIDVEAGVQVFAPFPDTGVWVQLARRSQSLC
jgi:hypothetical protein